MKKTVLLALLLSVALMQAQVRLKDIAGFSGLESKQLIGYGLVIGLDGTGDGSSSQMTIQSIKNMMERFGLTIAQNKIRPNNVAAVIVTATLPAFAKSGSTFDVTVSSVGDAKSLEGGTLLMTPLLGIDEELYAMAQGSVSIGGFNSSAAGTKLRKNFALVGRIPGGAVVEKEVFSQMLYNGELLVNLHNPDFTTAQRVATAINEYFEYRLAAPEDASSVQIVVPDSVLVQKKLIGFISSIENLEVVPEQRARVVINERTGTIVAGGNVELSEVAVAHGNLMIKINTYSQSQSVGFGMVEETTEYANVAAINEPARVMVLESSTVQELARALNSIKVTPRDLISIFQSLKAAGALQAELVIM